MDGLNPLVLLFRWVHVGSAIVLVGGAVFMRFVLMPSAASLPEGEHTALRERVLGRWKPFVHGLIALLFISGLYNMMSKIKEVTPTWHMLFGIKFLLAMAVFFFASALVGRSKGLAPLRAKPALWLGVNITLAALIVMISGTLKNLPLKATNAPVNATAQPAEPGNR